MATNYDDTEVGYRRPPKQHRFQKGVSGNPAGSSRKSRTRDPMHPEIANMWAQEGGRKRTIVENGRQIEITMDELAIRRAYLEAVAGKITPMRIVTSKSHQMERERRELWKERTLAAGELVGKQTAELHRQIEAGIKDPRVIPHPSDIDQNPLTYEIEIRGPKTEEEYEEMLAVQKSRDQLIELFHETVSKGSVTPNDVAFVQKRINKLNDYLPKRLYRPLFS